MNVESVCTHPFKRILRVCKVKQKGQKLFQFFPLMSHILYYSVENAIVTYVSKTCF